MTRIRNANAQQNNWKLSLILLTVLWSCSGRPRNEAPQRTEVSDLQKIKLKDLNGQPIDLDQFNSKTIFINFWATWCKPCIQEMPTINSAQRMFKDNDVVFLFASNEEIDRINKFSAKHPYEFLYVKLENMGV